MSNKSLFALIGGVLLAIVLVERFAPRGLARVSVLAGLLIGTLVALFVPLPGAWRGPSDTT